MLAIRYCITLVLLLPASSALAQDATTCLLFSQIDRPIVQGLALIFLVVGGVGLLLNKLNYVIGALLLLIAVAILGLPIALESDFDACS
jgi:hypothetical protein